jgi:hypothetical protein
MELCIYCQTNPQETADHVPPKGLFKEPRPSNLITVPACFQCNNSFGADDDYFLNLALEWGASETSDGKGVVDKRLRSMKRKEGRSVWKPFFDKFKAVEVYSPGGLYLANSFACSLDTARLIRTVNRIIRGLYFEVTKTPLPAGDYTRSMLFSHYVEKHKDESEAMEFIPFIPQLPGRVIGEGTFEFRYCLLDQDCYSSFWYLEFYRRFGFVGTTGNQDEAKTSTETTS